MILKNEKSGKHVPLFSFYMYIFGHVFLSDMDKGVHEDSSMEQRTVVLSDVMVDGDMHVRGDLSLSGRVNGNIFCEGKVVVEKAAVVQGDIVCGELDLESEIVGSVKARRVILREGSSIQGEVETSCLHVATKKIGISRLRLVENKEITLN